MTLFFGEGKGCCSAATAMTGISQIILDYNATLTPCRARSCIINLTAPPPLRALSLRQKRRQREPRCVALFFFFFYVYSAVFPSSSLRVSECLSTSHRMNYSSATPPSGPNPRLCAAAVPVRPWGIALYCIGWTLLSHMCVILPPPNIPPP